MVMDVNKFLEHVAKGMLSKTEFSEQKEMLAQEIFLDADKLDINVFKQRAMNNNVILNCFGLLEYVFAPTVQAMEHEMVVNKRSRVLVAHSLPHNNDNFYYIMVRAKITSCSRSHLHECLQKKAISPRYLASRRRW